MHEDKIFIVLLLKALWNHTFITMNNFKRDALKSVVITSSKWRQNDPLIGVINSPIRPLVDYCKNTIAINRQLTFTVIKFMICARLWLKLYCKIVGIIIEVIHWKMHLQILLNHISGVQNNSYDKNKFCNLWSFMFLAFLCFSKTVLSYDSSMITRTKIIINDIVQARSCKTQENASFAKSQSIFF